LVFDCEISVSFRSLISASIEKVKITIFVGNCMRNIFCLNNIKRKLEISDFFQVISNFAAKTTIFCDLGIKFCKKILKTSQKVPIFSVKNIVNPRAKVPERISRCQSTSKIPNLVLNRHVRQHCFS